MSRDQVKLKPPLVEEDQNKYKSEKSRTLVLILTGVIISLIIVIILLIALPSPTGHLKLSEHIDGNNDKVVNNNLDNTPAKKDIEKNSEQISTNSETHNKRREDNKKLFDQTIELDWMLKRSDAENSKLNIWSEKDYLLAVEAADKAQQFKNNEQFEDAVKHYEKAMLIIDTALETKNEKFDLFLSNALEAMEKEQLSEASEWFKKAQAIEQENKAVSKGLYQIERREEVEKDYNLALKLEQENKFEQALLLLDKILIIDPNYKKAEEKRLSVNQTILEHEFKQSISQVLKLIENNKYYEARVELKQAEKINSSDGIIEELNKIISEKILVLSIKQLKKQAGQQEKQEHWKKALKSYLKINNYDGTVSGIEVDIRRVSGYIKLNKMLDNIILKPQRLYDDLVFEESKRTLLYVENELLKNNAFYYPLKKTPEIADKLITAKKIMADASKKIAVIINSDKQTDIVIYKIGKLGKLDTKILYLRSGNYTIVGSRKGYRDYRKKIQLMPSQEKVNINVICSEKI